MGLEQHLRDKYNYFWALWVRKRNKILTFAAQLLLLVCSHVRHVTKTPIEGAYHPSVY
jgi:hypothetical protein